MTNNEMALELLELIGPDPKQNCILKGAIRQLLKNTDATLKHEPEAETSEPIPKKKPAAKKPAKDKTTFDVGKMNALLKAGWSITKIADEMGVSAPTVRKYMKQEGYK